MALLDRVHDAGRLITIMVHRVTNFEKEITEWKSGGVLEVVVVAEQRATMAEQQAVDLHVENKKLLAKLAEATQRLDF
ncbi:hypothetical protein BHE74_00032313 [Ensete ventricosum]|nr:hypothetical protein BHE74_00032313 [Ensete ventricosum]